MKSSTILTITTALGNVAVLVGLVFLIIELKQTSSIARSEIRQDRSNAMIEEFSQIYSEDSVLSVHMALMEGDFEAINGLEKERLFWFERVRYQRFEDVYYQWEKGLIDESVYRFSLDMAASRLPLWRWLLLADPNPKFKTAVEDYMKSDGFKQSRFAAKFSEWSAGKESPNLGLGSPTVFA